MILISNGREAVKRWLDEGRVRCLHQIHDGATGKKVWAYNRMCSDGPDEVQRTRTYYAITEAGYSDEATDELMNGCGKTCGECCYFTGEECDGKHEGCEAYDDSDACDEFCEMEVNK